MMALFSILSSPLFCLKESLWCCRRQSPPWARKGLNNSDMSHNHSFIIAFYISWHGGEHLRHVPHFYYDRIFPSCYSFLLRSNFFHKLCNNIVYFTQPKNKYVHTHSVLKKNIGLNNMQRWTAYLKSGTARFNSIQC